MAYFSKIADENKTGIFSVSSTDFTLSGSPAVIGINPAVDRGNALFVSSNSVTSSTASVSISIPNTYAFYVLGICGLRPVSNGARLRFTVSTSGGTFTGNYHSRKDVPSVVINTSTAGFLLYETLSNQASEDAFFRIFIPNPAGTTYYKTFMIEGTCYDSTSTLNKIAYGGVAMTTSALTQLQFFFSTGNIAKGDFYLYGLS
ncbi:MAG: hypothetical protein K0S07_928 [Chlamydiales bacterium]|nr:hypothetical protein [Chlamydiales bacterium]